MKFVIRIFQKQLQLGASNLVSLERIMSRLPGKITKKTNIFFSYWPLQIWKFHRSFKLSRLIEDNE